MEVQKMIIMSVKEMIIYFLVGLGIGVSITVLGYKYHDNRYDEKLYSGRRDMVVCLFASLLSGTAMILFIGYDYSVIRAVSLVILLSSLLVISKIDMLHKVIPNKILIALLLVKVLVMFVELCLYKESFAVLVMKALLGVFYGTVVFIVIRLFSKKSIGMGDIKLFAIIGLYIGNGSIIPALFVSSFIALIYGTIMLAKKAISKKDTMSFGPFIAAGTIIVMILGI